MCLEGAIRGSRTESMRAFRRRTNSEGPHKRAFASEDGEGPHKRAFA
jgi:hypothetical protein